MRRRASKPPFVHARRGRQRKVWIGPEAGLRAYVAQTLELFKKSISGGFPVGADRDPAQLKNPEQSNVVSSSIMGSRFGADLQV